MKEMWFYIKIMIAAMGGWLGALLGGWDGPLYALITFITIDYVTGVMCGIVERRLSSEIGFRGIFRKVAMLMIVGVGAMLDAHIIRTGDVLRTAVVFYYVSNEAISILENVARLGLPVPEKLRAVLNQLHDDQNHTENEYHEKKRL